MYEIYGLQRKVEVLERELQCALERLDRIETALRFDEVKLQELERELNEEHHHIERLELESPFHRVPIGL